MRTPEHYADTTRLLVNWLRLNPGYHSVAEISEATGLRRDYAKVYLSRMHRAGWLARAYRGEYMAVRLDVEFYPCNALDKSRA